MLTISNEQMNVLNRVMENRFTKRMVLHVQEHFPEKCEAIEEQDLTNTLTDGIQNAKGYGISEKKDICKYINLMFVLGLEFDRDAAYPWAGEILRDKEIAHGATKMTLLVNAASAHLKMKR